MPLPKTKLSEITEKLKSQKGKTEPTGDQLRNREGWLTEVAAQVAPLFRGFVLDPFRLTCGWPSRLALGTRVRRLGECHGAASSTGGLHEIFISPLLDKPLEVAGTVCHEVAHVAAGIKAGHKGLYLKVIRQVGLTKNKPTQAMPGPLLEERLLKVVEKLGPYPHQAMSPKLKEVVKDRKDFSVVCPECECLVRMTGKWIDRVGFPTCACGALMELKV